MKQAHYLIQDIHDQTDTLNMPQELIYIFFLAIPVAILLLILNNNSEKYLNADGYVVLKIVNELEHRHIAMQLLGRDLYKNEIVHHINGRKADNQISNLCLMDRQKHEHFHSWLRWKKEKSGKYPTINLQKKILKNEYNGKLLEEVLSLKSEPKQRQQKKLLHTQKSHTEQERQLFALLREERKRQAEKKNLPVYMIFNNKTLVEMTKKWPTTEEAMLKVTGVGPEKMCMYGHDFIRIVDDFKNKLTTNFKSNKDSA